MTIRKDELTAWKDKQFLILKKNKMKSLVICSEFSTVKFENFMFDVSSSLFTHAMEVDIAAKCLVVDDINNPAIDLNDKDLMVYEKISNNYEVHKSQVLHTELTERGIMNNDSSFLSDFNSDDMIVSREEFLNQVYLKFEVCIF
jgi:hypothetical protein